MEDSQPLHTQKKREADQILRMFIWDYLNKNNLRQAAACLHNDGGVPPGSPPVDSPRGFLNEWWTVFWDVFASTANRAMEETQIPPKHQATVPVTVKYEHPPPPLPKPALPATTSSSSYVPMLPPAALPTPPPVFPTSAAAYYHPSTVPLSALSSTISPLHLPFTPGKGVKRKSNDEARPRGSKYRGVSRNGNQWQVLIMVDKKKRYIGSFASEMEAAKAYDRAALQNHGLKAKTNFEYTEDELNKILSDPPILKKSTEELDHHPPSGHGYGHK
eukprot:GILK01005909.1.p1 GENE.GILK01005909.1~~GILK01005909.1.p1  ORF type:complete len:274 (-),score=38.93 GILK01005909.1:217-1038(-)